MTRQKKSKAGSAGRKRNSRKRDSSVKKKAAAAKGRGRRVAKKAAIKKSTPRKSRKRVSRVSQLEGAIAERVTGRCLMTYNGNTYCEDGVTEAECMRKPQQYLGATVNFFPNEECR